MGLTEGNAYLYYFTLLFLVPTTISDEGSGSKCDSEILLDSSTANYTISSPGYPDTYSPGLPYTWCVSAPENYTITILCDELDIPKSVDCEINALTVTIGDNKTRTRSYCGSNPFRATSDSNEMTIQLQSSKKSRRGKFNCRVVPEEPERYSMRAIVYEDCDCGYSYRARIVGGQETGVNEYPFMAGLVDNRRGPIIVCGATIISRRFVVTANHCLAALRVDQTAVVVGEHDTTTGSETPETKLIRAKQFVPYPYYNSETRQYDIALIELVSQITYTMRVAPVCLPFMSRNWDLTGEAVTVLGWGTTDFGGPRSRVLQKGTLDLINIQNCRDSYGEIIEPYTQLCSYRQNVDACQYDSGGPLTWFNYYINRYEFTGIVSYGKACATEVPSVNTKVAPFLQWILDNTPSETYCYKSQ
uniref:Peptidase S1 domain-containing protein n=1 Tax=Cuerna arida TaxID=1464854 RepID=A0A1B6F896_9HEMI